MKDRSLLGEKLRESLSSILPITGIVFLLCLALLPIPSGLMLAFLTGSVLMILGMGLFSLGADMAMSRIGGHLGAKMTATRKLWLIALLSFLLGTAITLAEPDLQVLAGNVPGINKSLLVLTVALGVGLFLTVAMLRILFAVSLRMLLLVFYALVFVLACFMDRGLLSVAFDAGGVTTGPMTVPFIMALGLGVSAIRSDENAKADSFGLVALCSIGPILAVMLLSLLSGEVSPAYESAALPAYLTTNAVGGGYLAAFPAYLGEAALALLPIFAFFLLFQLLSLHLRKKPLLQILLGVGYTYVGLVLFLTGVNVGFAPLGEALGESLAAQPWRYLTVPLAMLMGWFIIRAEPAVHILTKQVEEITAGAVSEKAMELSLSLAVAFANALAMIRVLSGAPILAFLLPGYALALLLSFFVPDTFTGIAFDSGGVASGPLTASFMLPLAIGASRVTGGNVMTDAFGLVSLVAMTPLITIQSMGALYTLRQKREAAASAASYEEEIVELWEIA